MDGLSLAFLDIYTFAGCMVGHVLIGVVLAPVITGWLGKLGPRAA